MPNFVREHWAIAILMIAALGANACATLPGSGPTPAQQYVEAKAEWLMTEKVVWAMGPAGQARPDILIQMQAVAYRVSGVLNEIDIAMCYQSPATVFDPAPPPHPQCVPLTGAVAERRFAFAARVITVAIAEIHLLSPPKADP
jgi:hypothetical protein